MQGIRCELGIADSYWSDFSCRSAVNLSRFESMLSKKCWCDYEIKFEILFSGADQPCEIPCDSQACYYWQTSCTMSAPCIAQRCPSQGTGDLWYHLQMYRHTSTLRRPVHILCRAVPTSRVCCHECETHTTLDLRDPLCTPGSAHQTRSRRDVTGVVAGAGGGIGTLWQVCTTWSSNPLLAELLQEL